MTEILYNISAKAIALADFVFDENIKSSNWLGNDKASLEEVLRLEERLNVVLPEDYKLFLMTTNGFHAALGTEPTFERCDRVDYLVNVDEYGILDSYNLDGLEEVYECLKRSIVIAGIDEEQQFLLIPPSGSNVNWGYWKFANWIPGEEVYDGLEHYFNEVIVFLDEEITY